jgi:hypothetical protein
LAACPNAKEDLEKHGDRLAEALELDRASRVLEFRDPSMTALKQVAPAGLKGAELEAKTVWKGTEWVLGGPEQSKSAFRSLLVYLKALTLYRNLGDDRNSSTSDFSFQISISFFEQD